MADTPSASPEQSWARGLILARRPAPQCDVLSGGSLRAQGRLCYHETEMLLHGRKITVIVEQHVVILDAESADDQGGRFADRDA